MLVQNGKVRDVPELMPMTEQGRNEKCSCGSNRKYKVCCGKSKENLGVLKKGRMISFCFYNGDSEPEARAIYEGLKKKAEEKISIPLNNTAFSFRIARIEALEIPNVYSNTKRYKIEVEGEIV